MTGEPKSTPSMEDTCYFCKSPADMSLIGVDSRFSWCLFGCCTACYRRYSALHSCRKGTPKQKMEESK